MSESATMRTKALLIGIQYKDSRKWTEADGPQFAGQEGWDDLDGPHNDVARMKGFLDHGPWQYGHIRVLLDKEGFMRPNRENIIESLYWLTDNATKDHRLFLHYSGHGSQAMTSSPSEPDGFDETLVPVDCPPSETEEGVQGMIRDNDLKKILVDRLPVGCHLTALFDCCHSGSILDLRHCYPRYLSIPFAWYSSGPAHQHPRLNRGISEQTSKSSTLPPDFENTIPPDLDDLRTPLSGIVQPLVYPSTPTPMHPHGIDLPDPAEFDSPIVQSSFVASTAEEDSVTAGLSNMFRRVSLREQRMGSRLGKMFGRRESRQMSISKGLALAAASTMVLATDPVDVSPKSSGHFRQLSNGSSGRKQSIGLGLRVMHSATTVATALHVTPTAEQLGLGMGQKRQLSSHAIDAWRASIVGGGNVPLRINSQGFSEDTFLCDERTLSPTSTISAIPMRQSFLMMQRTSVVQGMVNQALRTGELQACYEDPEIAAPFQTVRYDKPIKSRATFHGFHQPPPEDKPSPRVSSFSACYDDQAVFETGNGDGLLTSAFIKCMTDMNHEVTYGEMMAEMKKFFVRTNAERDEEDRFALPPFPMLSSSYPIDLQSMVEI